jgi:hypothetical protein
MSVNAMLINALVAVPTVYIITSYGLNSCCTMQARCEAIEWIGWRSRRLIQFS